jgi:Zn-dependent peptidase ImmA (M78 family)
MSFNPSRLILARKRRGLSKTSLSETTNLALRTLGYYYAGEVEPSDEAIRVLSRVLQFPPDFFYGDDIEEIDLDGASFRSLKSMTSSLREASLAAGSLCVELEKWITKRFDLPNPSIPSLAHIEPETAADMLRAEWGLGLRPLNNVIHIAESHGVRVFSLPIESAKVDAFSVWHNNTPFVFLNPMKSGERGRMDISHELGHLCLHGHGVPRNRQAEIEADRFASAFLMPREDVLAHIPRAWSMNVIHTLKTRWKVSASALLVRMRHLDILTEWQYRSFFIELSKAGQTTKELNGIPRESSQVIGKVFAALRSEGTSRNAIARDLSITPAELNSLIAGLTISAVSSTTEHIPNTSDEPQERPKLRIV